MIAAGVAHVMIGAVTTGVVTVSDAWAVAEAPLPVQVRTYEYVLADVGLTVKVPLGSWLPLHAPLAVHEVALVLDHVSTAVEPNTMLLGWTARDTVGGGVDTTAAVVTNPTDALELVN